MARFYAKFDSQSVAGLDNDLFDKRRISLGSASAALLRDGLIASRSAVSADVYDDLDVSNRLWSNGTYFPPDQQTFPSATLTSWSTAYSSSVPGIQSYSAGSNTYGGTSEVNYSLRPTASITSTMNTLVGPESPLDPVQLNYQTYLSASNAVKAVLDTIQNAASPSPAAQTPYTRPGNIPSRTLHSIWHDPELNYFAWDDFTPGAPISGDDDVTLLGYSPVNTSPANIVSCSMRIAYAKTYNNDFNSEASMSISIRYVSLNGGSSNYYSDFTQIGVTGSSQVGNQNRFDFITSPLDCVGGSAQYNMHVTMSFFDVKIRTSEGPKTQFIATDLAGGIPCVGPPPGGGGGPV